MLRKGIFVIAQIALLLAVISQGAIQAAEVLSLRDFQDQVNKSKLDISSLIQNNMLVNFKTVSSELSTVGKVAVTHEKHQQFFKGVEVINHQAILTRGMDGSILRLHGYVAQNIQEDVDSVVPSISQKQAVEIVRSKHLEAIMAKLEDIHFSDLEVKTVIYVDREQQAHLAYRVHYLSDVEGGGMPSRPVVMVDAHSGEILSFIDSLTFSRNNAAKATGFGGNIKTGRYHYGTDYPELNVEKSGNDCVMKFGKVQTIDLENKGSGNPMGDTGLNTNPFKFACYQNNNREINGAYSPLNDAHFFGTLVFNMYQDWYGVNPLRDTLTLRVHYGQSFENAFWDGKQMTFGDGKDMFYPLVVLDVTAHEVSHGFTEFNSALVYASESGGINEAFSDMAGEAAEFYARGSNDFLVGGEIAKTRDALRYMNDPPKDGKSIDHVSNFVWSNDMICTFCRLLGMCDGLCTDVHHSSGIYNKVFHMISTAPGWDTKKAFDIFVRANQKYWSANTTFADGAKGVLDSAVDLGYETEIVKSSFRVVGINL